MRLSGGREPLPRPALDGGMDECRVWLSVELRRGFDQLVWAQLDFELRRPRAIALWDWVLPDRGLKGWFERPGDRELGMKT